MVVLAGAEERGVADRTLLAHTSYLCLDGVDDPREVAGRLWSLDALGVA